MKNIHFIISLLLLPLIGVSQESKDNSIESGLRIGLNTELIFFGEFGVNVAYVSGENSFYTQLNYNRFIIFEDKNYANIDFTENTNSYYCATGPVLKVGYQKDFAYSIINRRNYFYSMELIYKDLSYDDLSLVRPSDNYYFDQISISIHNQQH